VRNRIVKITVFAGLVLGLSLFQSCGGNDDTDPPKEDKKQPASIPNLAPTPALSSTECPDGTVWTYDNMGEAYLLNYCTSCHAAALTDDARHGSPVGVDFDTPEAVQVWRANIIETVSAKKPTMPPSLHVPAKESKKFLSWLNCGAPTGSDNIY
jgi:hypothetical protein